MMPTDSVPRWRWLTHPDRPGAWHMAADDFLLAAANASPAPPVLRLYSWQPACLSLGYAQSLADVDRAACAVAGIDVVRRSSGGRAVLHATELTYSVVAAVDDPVVGGTIGQAYAAIAVGLLGGLHALNVAARLAPGEPGGAAATRRSGACFAASSRSELVWHGRKLVGSAQVRRGSALLQHGSLPLAPSEPSLADLLATAPRQALASHLAASSVCLAEAGGLTAPFQVVLQRFAAGFAAALGVELAADELSAGECRAVDDLRCQRHASTAWLERR